MVGFVLVIGQIADGTSLGLGWNGDDAEHQGKGEYFQCFFQNDSALIIFDNDGDGLLLRKMVEKLSFVVGDMNVALRERDSNAI